MAVLQELRELTNLEEVEKYTDSQAINIDDRIQIMCDHHNRYPQKLT